MKKSVNDIVAELKNQINYLQNKNSKLKERLDANFVHEFAWVGEDLFINEFKLQQFKHKHEFLSNLETDENNFTFIMNNELKNIINSYEDYLSREYNVRTNSSGVLHREISTWMYVATMDLKKFFQNLVEGDIKIIK